MIGRSVRCAARRCRPRMRIAFLTGIWPPDVGGPATHGPDFSRFLVGRGHTVRVVTMGDGEPTERPCEVDVVSRRLPFPLRYGLVALRGARAARRADVLYASATSAPLPPRRRWRGVRSSPSSSPTRPTSERAATGSSRGRLADFQSASLAPDPGAQGRAQRVVAARRRRSSSRARSSPGSRWAGGSDRGRVHVLTNPAPPPSDVQAEQLAPGTFVFVGRLTEAKDLPTAIAAMELVPAARLVLVGDGPDRAELERAPPRSEAREPDRVPRRRSPATTALQVVAGADAALLSSAWENLPHSAVEALSVGVPMVATAVGGVPEVVHDGENGLLVPPGRPDELAAAIRRVLDETGLRERLAARAKPSVEAISSDGDLRPARGAPRGGCRDERAAARPLRRPLALLAPASRLAGEEVGRGRGAARLSDPGRRRSRQPLQAERFRLTAPARPRRLDGILFYLRLPLRVRRELREFQPRRRRRRRPLRRCGRARGSRAGPLAYAGDRRGPRRLAHVHALYGSPSRKLLARVGRPARGVASAARRCDAGTLQIHVAASSRTCGAGPPTAIFPTYSDLSAFTERPVARAAASARRCSSSARSSRTRTSTGSRRRGGASQPSCRRRSSSSSGGDSSPDWSSGW